MLEMVCGYEAMKHMLFCIKQNKICPLLVTAVRALWQICSKCCAAEILINGSYQLGLSKCHKNDGKQSAYLTTDV